MNVERLSPVGENLNIRIFRTPILVNLRLNGILRRSELSMVR